MTKKTTNRQTEKAMYMSIISTALCVVMLIGLTFAWFTATVTSDTNVIKTEAFDAQVFWSDVPTAPATSVLAAADDSGWTNLDNTKPYYDVHYMPGSETVRYFVFYNNSNFSVSFALSLREITCADVLKDNLTVYKKVPADAALTYENMIKVGTIAEVDAAKDSNANSGILSTSVPANSKKVVAVSVVLPENYNDPTSREADFKVIVIASQKKVDETQSATVSYAPTAETVLQTPTATVTIPANATTTATANDTLKLTVEPGEADDSLVVESGAGTTTYEVNLTNQDNVKVTSESGIKVELNIGVVDLQKFYHNTTALTLVGSAAEVDALNEYYYNVSTGIITFMTDSFSPFTATYEFAGGIGTAEHPYLIENAEQMQHISDFSDDQYYYYKVNNGITTIDGNNWTSVRLYGSFDGNGVLFNNLDSTLFRWVWADPSNNESVTIKNLTINANIVSTGSTAALMRSSCSTPLVIDNVNITGRIEGTEAASYIVYGAGNAGDYANWYDASCDFTFINCISDATLVATNGGAGGFIDNPFCDVTSNGGVGNSMFTLIDSLYKGEMHATTSNNPYSYFSYQGNALPVKISYSDNFIAQYGNPDGVYYYGPAGTNDDGVIFFGNYPLSGHSERQNYASVDRYLPAIGSTITKVTGTVPEKGDTFSVPKASNASYAVAILQIGPNDNNGSGNFVGTYMSEVLTAANGSFTTENIKYFDVAINAAGATETGLVGNTFNIVASNYGTTYGSAIVSIIQYTADGKTIISVTNFDIKN